MRLIAYLFVGSVAVVWLLDDRPPPLTPEEAATLSTDWPTFRCDAQRSAAIRYDLPGDLHRLWARRFAPPAPAWPGDERLTFDAALQPVIAGDTLVFGSSRDDSVTALDARTGRDRWRIHLDGPIRFAPLLHGGAVYVACDDGHLYCLDAADGSERWRFRGGLSDRTVLGNGRLISAWPARGAPAIADDTVYFAAGIWPFMGVFVHALDAESGRVVWTNSGEGARWTVQPHSSEAFAGLAPQGYLAVSGDALIVPNGRAGPAILDRRTGALRYFRMAHNRGNYLVTANSRFVYNDGQMTDLHDGEVVLRGQYDDWRIAGRNRFGSVLLDGRTFFTTAGAFRLGEREAVYERLRLRKRWDMPEFEGRLWLRTRGHVYANDGRDLLAISTPRGPFARPGVTSRLALDGDPGGVIAAGGRLYVSTLDGRITCYGPRDETPTAHEPPALSSMPVSAVAGRRAGRIIEASGVTDGYGVVLGIGTGDLIEALVRQSDLHVIAVDPDPARVQAARERLYQAGLYGGRAAARVGDPPAAGLPPYLASLVVVQSAQMVADRAGLERVFRILRPYGGVAVMADAAADGAALMKRIEAAGLPGARVARTASGLVTLTRSGPLPGAADWSHQYADAGNSVVSQDDLVRTPLGLLWFGGSTNEGILPRHGHGPTPQVVGGRLFIEGPDSMRAMDVYTGRVLWERYLPGVGDAFRQQTHQPGANLLGSNYASAQDGVYVVTGKRCLWLDPTTGRTVKAFGLPTRRRGSQWGYVAAWRDLLIGTASPRMYWSAEFQAGEFAGPKYDAAVLGSLLGWLRAIRDVRIVEGDDGSDAVTLARSLNVLLTERALLPRLPGEPTPDLAAIQKRIDQHVAGKARAWRGDSRLMWLNRQLVQQANPDLPRRRRRTYETPEGAVGSHLFAVNRHTGALLWTRPAEHEFRHNGIAVAAGRVFCIDRRVTETRSLLDTATSRPAPPGTLLALDARSGDLLWRTDAGVFGTWLGYAREHDVLLHARRPSRDMIDEPGERMSVLRAADGSLLWDRAVFYEGPCLLHGDTIITQGEAYDLLTGARRQRTHPLTGRPVPWSFRRKYGCNTAIGGRHLLTFRSAAAGFYDLAADGGTGNWGGFRAGCSSNLIPADGVLCAPDYTRTCTCAYHNQTSLALVHDPDVEMWTFSSLPRTEDPIVRVGLNLGAPGDRRDTGGTLWLEHPHVGGPSPEVPVRVTGPAVRFFRRHASTITAGPLRWVAASGATGVREVTLTLRPAESGPRRYTVSLWFAEPDAPAPGDRVFDIALQGRPVVRGFDIVKVAGGPDRAVVRRFPGVEVADDLRVTLTPAPDARVRSPLLCGIEVIAE